MSEESKKRQLANLIPIKPGHSGNPKGRPKGSPNIGAKLRKMLDTVCDISLIRDEEMKLMIEMLRQGNQNTPVKLMKIKDVLNARIIIEAINGNEKFVKILLDRVYGRAPVNITGDLTIHSEIDKMSDSELMAHAELIRQRRLDAAIDAEIHEAVVIEPNVEK